MYIIKGLVFQFLFIRNQIGILKFTILVHPPYQLLALDYNGMHMLHLNKDIIFVLIVRRSWDPILKNIC